MRQVFLFIGLSVIALGCLAQVTGAELSADEPTALISDHGYPVDSTKSNLFYIRAIDGKPVSTSLEATRRATYNRGLRLFSKYLEHRVPARAIVLGIVGTHVTAAPLQEIGLRLFGDFLS